jgi:2-polyprenyl-3-methyl-5-hydroxy-6-metoxy-1,4-benzoquinol methylase
VKDYVREYFDRHAERWVEAAYAGETRFPIGPERVRLALEAVAPAFRDGAALVDLGCGGGQLCLAAAELGWRVVGVDAAPAMVEEARERCAGREVELVVAPFDGSGFPDGSFDAVTALGLIEYLPEDSSLLAEARRLLRPGGRFAVSCRNRLYNPLSANRYTERELTSGDAAALLAELEATLAGAGGDEIRALAEALAEAGADLAEAAANDATVAPPELHEHTSAFTEDRRQHTPSQVERAASEAGFRPVATLALHPHPLPPSAERLSPRVYNRLALAWQRPLERSPLGLAFCSAFVAVFERSQ